MTVPTDGGGQLPMKATVFTRKGSQMTALTSHTSVLRSTKITALAVGAGARGATQVDRVIEKPDSKLRQCSKIRNLAELLEAVSEG
jgi:hypothetical protein